MDLYSRKIISWVLSETLEALKKTDLCVQTIDELAFEIKIQEPDEFNKKIKR